MTANIENWAYKSLAEVEALTDADLARVHSELCKAIRLFNKARCPMTDEMFWQLMVIPGEVEARRKRKNASSWNKTEDLSRK